jgi:iron-sulfur cluster assembly protein
VSITQQPETVARIALTESAIDQVREFMKQERIAVDTAGLRVSATPGGCSGLRYWLNIEEHALPDDHVVEQDGLRIFLDASSARHLSGAQIDFISTVDASGFKVRNPNEPSNCSCDCSEECSA